jgi:hypothetical protein
MVAHTSNSSIQGGRGRRIASCTVHSETLSQKKNGLDEE